MKSVGNAAANGQLTCVFCLGSKCSLLAGSDVRCLTLLCHCRGALQVMSPVRTEALRSAADLLWPGFRNALPNVSLLVQRLRVNPSGGRTLCPPPSRAAVDRAADAV